MYPIRIIQSGPITINCGASPEQDLEKKLRQAKEDLQRKTEECDRYRGKCDALSEVVDQSMPILTQLGYVWNGKSFTKNVF